MVWAHHSDSAVPPWPTYKFYGCSFSIIWSQFNYLLQPSWTVWSLPVPPLLVAASPWVLYWRPHTLPPPIGSLHLGALELVARCSVGETV